ncbi:hypothetical protein [Staphylococcus agnetis]|uniref:hypothetical protein n=1 Tax=Staphylococcus agnetis TaxID=985762 RepID=UPI0004E3AB73|nr:hypothetical protein [Staphylococcus agnetis]KFE42583.1 hypothetical protein SAGN_02497 [Staphylococcus agnetis]
MSINIQRFEEKDAEEIVKLIHRAIFETNISDYSKEDLVKDAENIINAMNIHMVLFIAKLEPF